MYGSKNIDSEIIIIDTKYCDIVLQRRKLLVPNFYQTNMRIWPKKNENFVPP